MPKQKHKLVLALLYSCLVVLIGLAQHSFAVSASRLLGASLLRPPLLSSRTVRHIGMRGVSKEISSDGDGVNFPQPGDVVTMQYKGTYGGSFGLFETQFDSSYDRGDPIVFTLGRGQVIKGWDEGVPQMSLGEQAVLLITSDYAYGERGSGSGSIPPNTDLKFFVELLKIERGKFTYEATSR